jgi:arylformamidase
LPAISTIVVNARKKPGHQHRELILPMVKTMLYDVTPVVSERLQVWPGDIRPRRHVTLDMKRGDHLTLSSLKATLHLGAHADAPSHYGPDGRTMEAQDLSYYLGPCQVIHIKAERNALIRPEHVKADIHAERLLIATATYPDPEQFNDDFAALDPGLVDWLHARGVLLVGVDTPSVDPFSSKELPAHRCFLKNDMAILEGLVLAKVPEGDYELIALPLRLEGFDASPVRAVLRSPAPRVE